MKICFINSLWGTYARGGAENILKILIDEMLQQGHQVFLITTHPLPDTVVTEKNGLKVFFLSSNFYNQDKLPYWLRFFWHILNIINVKKYHKVREILEREKVEIVWTHNLVGLGFFILNLFKNKRFRHYHTLHDIQLLHPSGLMMWGREHIISSIVARVYQDIIKSYISSNSTIISPSQWLLDFHKQQGFFKTNRSLVLPNPVKEEIAISERSSDSERKFTFLYVGQIENHKGIQLLIDAFTSLDTQDVELIVVGPGSQLDNLKNSISDQRIIFKGNQSSEEVKKIMREADCLVVPSLCYENYPTVILEARSVGLPVIGSSFGGIKEMIQNENLLFIPTVSDLRNKLDWCIVHDTELKNIINSEKNNLILVEDYITRISLTQS